MQIVLYQPEIPPNTGNVARLCAGAGVALHLIEPLGFKLENRYMKRAGLDYWPNVEMNVWKNFEQYLAGPGLDKRIVATSARGGTPLHRFSFTSNDALLFGPETRGLPEDWRKTLPCWVCIPASNNIRSLNLSTAAGIVLYFAMNSANMLDSFAQQ